MAQEEGFEPPTSRLTAGCSTTELLLNKLVKDLKSLARKISDDNIVKTENPLRIKLLAAGLAVYSAKKRGHSLSTMKLKNHIFICTNQRPEGHPRGCCQSKSSEDLVKSLKEGLSQAGLAREVRAQKAGCLDDCESGHSMVVYPEGVWYGKVKPDDIPEIIQSHLIGGKPVERLRILGK